MSKLPSMDTGTSEIAKRHHLGAELIGQRSGLSVHMRVLDEGEIDRLLLKRHIDLAEHHIAVDFLRDVWRARMIGIPTSNLDSPCSIEYRDGNRSWANAINKLTFIIGRLDADLGEPARNMVLRALSQDWQIREPHDLEIFRASLVSYTHAMHMWRF